MNPSGAASLLLALGLAAAPAAAWITGGPAPDPERGRAIFHRGVTADGGEIVAAMGPESFEVAASLVPCASCHGHDGRGRPEGGIAPSNLTWASLTDPRGARRPDRRQHPPYDERSLLKAITMGVDPAGNELNDTMPEYRLSRRDAADLVAYMKVLGEEKDPGIADDTLRVATLLRPGDPRGEATRGALSVFFDDLNEGGGVYGRRVELEVFPLPPPPVRGEALTRAVRESWGDEAPFALVAPDMVGRARELTRLFDEESIPVIGPAALDPFLELPPNRHIFYLYGGVDEIARTLVEYASGPGTLSGGRLLILHGEGEGAAEWAAGAEDQARLGGWAGIRSSTLSAHLRQQAAQSAGATAAPVSALTPAETVLFLGRDAELRTFLDSAERRSWYPNVLVPGLLAAPALLEASGGFEGRLYCAFPTLLTDADPTVASGYWQLARKKGLGMDHLASQLAAVSAATLLVEGLNRAGRDLSREGLIESLEGLYDFSTGLTPQMAFTPNRRLGARGGHVVTVDLAGGSFEPTGKRIVPR